MNTAGYSVPVLPLSSEYVFILEELELAFTEMQLKEITKEWNKGAELEDIAEKHQRHIDEVFLALFHQARKRKIKRPFAYRRGGQ
ncbi:hypothetical protein [Ornithinibacillus xuwenensis]|uniref:Uncharacterized protein n=1 Tax=Ornithinibacillus xuwenensis TaxID=3144668 RepID=A0ABU9XFM2_9BACI